MVRTLFPRVWRPLDLLGPEWDRALESVFGADPFREVFDVLGGPSEREGFLALDAWETPQALHVEVDLPGVDADDVEVQVEAGQLVLKVTRRDVGQDGDRWLRRERGVGSFTRTLTLPSEIDPGAVEAQLADGVLRLRLPKAPEVQPRTIRVQSLES
jgi:HSP20 family protein